MVQAASLSDGIRAKSVTKTEGDSKIMNLSMTLFNSNNLYPFVYWLFWLSQRDSMLRRYVCSALCIFCRYCSGYCEIMIFTSHHRRKQSMMCRRCLGNDTFIGESLMHETNIFGDIVELVLQQYGSYIQYLRCFFGDIPVVHLVLHQQGIYIQYLRFLLATQYIWYCISTVLTYRTYSFFWRHSTSGIASVRYLHTVPIIPSATLSPCVHTIQMYTNHTTLQATQFWRHMCRYRYYTIRHSIFIRQITTKI